MNKIINLTPHTINVILPTAILNVLPNGTLARVATQTVEVATLHTMDNTPIPVRKTEKGEVQGVPEQEEGTVFLVSRMVRDALGEGPDVRPDVLCPDTGPSAQRDAKGQIVGVTGFTY